MNYLYLAPVLRSHLGLPLMDNLLKLSQVTPCQVLLHAPHTLSTYSGLNLHPQMIIAVPCYRSYYQRVSDLVASGEVIQVGSSYYLTTSQQSPRVPKLPSLPVDFDCSVDEWKALHLPTHTGIHTS